MEMRVLGVLGVFVGLTNSKVLLDLSEASLEDIAVLYASYSTDSMDCAIHPGLESMIIAWSIPSLLSSVSLSPFSSSTKLAFSLLFSRTLWKLPRQTKAALEIP